jgi:hypothetical protein
MNFKDNTIFSANDEACSIAGVKVADFKNETGERVFKKQ